VVRSAAALTLGAIAAALAACGDPLIVLGDAPGRMRIVIGVGDSIGTRIDSVATRTRLTEPAAVAFDGSQAVLYVADRGALVQSGGSTRRVARLFSVRSDGRLRVVFSTATCPSACPELVHSLAVGTNAALYITDINTQRVFRLDRGSSVPAVIVGNGTAGDSPDGTLATQSRVRAPAGIAVAPDGRIYFAEQAGHRIRAIDGDGRLRTIAGTGSAGGAGDGRS
jgi:sugar lactone lactonase YvrE